MGKPSRTRDLTGAVLLVLVGLLYMTGITDIDGERGADVGATVDVLDASAPLTQQVEADYRT